MPIPIDFPKSPFEIAHPKNRWKPDLESKESDFPHAPFVENIRKEIYEWRQFGYDGISETSRHLLNYWFN